jgi:hypothetical protein
MSCVINEKMGIAEVYFKPFVVDMEDDIPNSF